MLKIPDASTSGGVINNTNNFNTNNFLSIAKNIYKPSESCANIAASFSSKHLKFFTVN